MFDVILIACIHKENKPLTLFQYYENILQFWPDQVFRYPLFNLSYVYYCLQTSGTKCQKLYVNVLEERIVKKMRKIEQRTNANVLD